MAEQRLLELPGRGGSTITEMGGALGGRRERGARSSPGKNVQQLTSQPRSKPGACASECNHGKALPSETEPLPEEYLVVLNRTIHF